MRQTHFAKFLVHMFLPNMSFLHTEVFLLMIVLYHWISSQAEDSRLQSDLNALQLREKTWTMEINPSKCQVLRVTLQQKPVKSFYMATLSTLLTRRNTCELASTQSWISMTTLVLSPKRLALLVLLLSRNINRKIRAATYTSYINQSMAVTDAGTNVPLYPYHTFYTLLVFKST